MAGEITFGDGELLLNDQQLLDYLGQLQEAPSEYTVAFAGALAVRLSEELAPEAYPAAVDLLLTECQTGERGYVNPDDEAAKVPSDLIGLPPISYTGFRIHAKVWGHFAFGTVIGNRIDAAYRLTDGNE